jgi:O-antigen ligase
MPATVIRNMGNNLLTLGCVIFLVFIALFGYTNNFLFLGAPFGIALIAWAILNLRSFYWFFIFTIPLSATIYLLGGGVSTTIPDEPLMWLLLLLSLCMVAYNYKSFPQWFFRHPLTLIVIFQFVWLTIALVFSENFLLSLKFYVAKIWFLNAYFLLPALIFQKKSHFRTAFLLFIIPTTLHAVFVLSWHYSVGFDFEKSNTVVHPFYQNHVDYSTVLSMLFPLLLVAYQLCKGKQVLRWILGLAILFYIPAIYFASARAAILAVAFAMIMAFAVRKKIAQWIMPAGFVLLGCMLYFLAQNNTYLNYSTNKSQNYTQSSFKDAVAGVFNGEDMSTSERYYRWIASIRMSKDRPVTGVGPNNFYDYYKSYTVSSFQTWVSYNEERSTTHNYFLFMLVEQGWPAMLLYAALVITFFYQGQRIYHQAKDPFYKKVCMGLIMMFAAGFVNNFFSELLETHKIGALFYWSISLLIIVGHLSWKENNRLRDPGQEEAIK